MQRKARLALALSGALIAVAGCGAVHHAQPAVTRPASRALLHGLVPQPLPSRPSFTLTDTAGQSFRFLARTRGTLTYLYFGYTHCPDACPTTMAELASAFHHQPRGPRRRIEVVFVTVDPRRDTGHVLRAWLNHFDRAFVGLRGSDRQIRAAERAAGVPLAPPDKVRGRNYSVAHSTLVLPYSPDGQAHVVYTQGFHTADYAHDMPLLLRY